jgi:hypothetical protein
MSPTPTPSPSPIPWLGDDGFSHTTLSDALAQQAQIHNDLVASSTLTPAESAAFDRLMDGQPSSNAAPIVAGVLISVLVLVAAGVAFVRHRRAAVTSPAAAPSEV